MTGEEGGGLDKNSLGVHGEERADLGHVWVRIRKKQIKYNYTIQSVHIIV